MHQISLPHCRSSSDVKDRISGSLDPDEVADIETEGEVDGVRLQMVVVVVAVEHVTSNDVTVDADLNVADLGPTVENAEVGSQGEGIDSSDRCSEVNE